MGLWPACNLCSLQACSSSLGLAGTARARPEAFAQFVERALASPPLCCSSISACSCGVQQFFWGCGVWPPCHFHLQYTQAGARLPRAGVAGTVRARPATLAPYMERALASPPLRSSLVSAFSVVGGCIAIFLGVWPLVCL